MSLFDKAKKRTGGTPAASEPTAAAPIQKESAKDKAPWAVDSCRACGGTGISTKLAACRACDTFQERKGGVTSEKFVLTVADGKLSWKPKDGVQIKSEPAEPAAAPVAETGSVEVMEEPKEVKTKAARPRGRPRKVTPAAPLAEESNEAKIARVEKEADAVLTEPETIKVQFVDTPEERKQLPFVEKKHVAVFTPDGVLKGPFLYINAIPVGAPYTDLANVLAKEGADLAKEAKKDSYYMMHAFDRRDTIAAHAHAIAEELSGRNLVMLGDNPDLRSLAEALKPHCIMVVQGVAS